MSEKISSFRDLKVYQQSFAMQQAVFSISRGFPAEERYSLTDQVRRSSRSIGANIAESWQKRRYQAHFVSKLTDADGELAETEHWLQTALVCGYISSEKHAELIAQCLSIGAMLGKIMAIPETFCKRY
ncbi:MAG: four helix bundle protein [bacterium]